jgi:hypothetical protein
MTLAKVVWHRPLEKDCAPQQMARGALERKTVAGKAWMNPVVPTAQRCMPAKSNRTDNVACRYFNAGPDSSETRMLQAGQKTGCSGGGIDEQPVSEVLRGMEEKLCDYMEEGLLCPVAVGVAGVVSPTVLVIRRTSTRRLSARPSRVLFDSTGLSLPRPIT